MNKSATAQIVKEEAAPAILAIDDLQVAIGAQEILRGISLKAATGQVTTILGANGAGKTTLLRTISGIYRTKGGSILFDGEALEQRQSHEIVALGLAQAPEGRQIFGPMSIAENLTLGAGKVRGAEFARRFEHVLSLFPLLRERLSQKAGSLSGGEQQMLCIGRALMSSPRLLLLDEPSLGLAPKVVKQIFELIARIRSEGVSILLVEQNARAALKIADYAYVMDGGRILMGGTAGELLHDPRIRDVYLGSYDEGAGP